MTQDEQSVVETETPAQDPSAPTRRAPRRASRPAGGATPASPASPFELPVVAIVADEAPTAAEPATDAEPKADKADKAGKEAAKRPAKKSAGAGDKPALATTAVLFQAPDLSSVPKRAPRRAQAPAGPPKIELDLPEPKQAKQAKSKASRAGSEEAADAPVEVQIVLPEPRKLNRAENAAAKEVGVIEDELVSEGLDLIDLGPLDLIEDVEGIEIIPFDDDGPRKRRRRGGRGRRGGARHDGHGEDIDGEGVDDDADDSASDDDSAEGPSRRRHRSRSDRTERVNSRTRASDRVTGLEGSTRLEAKRQRRRDGRDASRRRQIITQAEFLARRESVSRTMVVRESGGRTQIAVLEDGVLVEHYVSQQSQASMVGNVYLGRVQNVLPSMEAAFVDVGKGRNAVLYAGEVNWDAAGIEQNTDRKIEQALKSGDPVLVQVTKDPIGHKGARLTSQVTLAGRYLVLVPGGGMTGISRKLPDTERTRLKKILREVVPDDAGVIVRTAAEGASEEELKADVERLMNQWSKIESKSSKKNATAPALLQGEPDLAIRVVRDIFNDDFEKLVVQGDSAWEEISTYVEQLAPDLRERVERWVKKQDVFGAHRVDEQLSKGMDRKVWLPSGGSLVIDRTEAMTVVDVNTGKFTGSGGTLEETVTRNNLEAAEEIVRQLRLRDIGGIIVIDFIDMVLESNRDLVLRRLVECLGRDRTKHQVAEVTSLGLVQMTRKRVGQGLVEAFSTQCDCCKGRGFIVHNEPIEKSGNGQSDDDEHGGEHDAKRPVKRKRATRSAAEPIEVPRLPEQTPAERAAVNATLASIAAAAASAHSDDDGKPAATRKRATRPAAKPDAKVDAADGSDAGSQPSIGNPES